MVTVIFYLAALVTIVMLSLILPVLVAIGVGETDVAYRLVIYLGVGGFLSTSTLLAISGRQHILDRISSIHLAVLAWIGIPLILAFPFADILAIDYGSALFETVSAFTTTAADQFSTSESLPKSMVLARAQIQWIGGLATLLTVVLIIAPSKLGGLPQFRGSAATNAVFSSPTTLAHYCWRLAQIYLVLTLACFGALLLTGIKPFESMVLSMAAVSSGGYLPGQENLSTTAGPAGMLIMAVFFLVACTSVFWHRMVIRLQIEDLAAHRESYFILAFWVGLSLYFTNQIVQASGSLQTGMFANFSEGLFNAASVISTSGLQSRPGIFALMAPTLILGILLLGAGSFSTSSGVKFYRVGGILRQTSYEINLLIHPNGIRSRKFGSVEYNIQLMKAIWAVFLLAIATVSLGSFVLTFHGMNFQAGLTASISAFTNAGPAYGPEWAPQTAEGWPHYSEMSLTEKMILATIMFSGRLEVVILLVAGNFAFWFKR